ncbi:GFA family protein [Vannielia litorea]|uniref:Uncharacterized conserved protein n=1 Tax=Vannielia litorea TaxID=1217970 RepID=A0A1N6HBA7_9RHOB|nr:GFA family protein [Vannielia litorea]SIO16949.1 Uncharacterized conserved protein [Vannielia litorea]
MSLRGRCNCGAVRFALLSAPVEPLACHCTQCRKQSGHYMADAEVQESEIVIEGEVRWYHASETARRGFCPVCGSGLFWQRLGSGDVGFSLGALEGPTGLRLEKHIHTASKGDYYEIADGLPQE